MSLRRERTLGPVDDPESLERHDPINEPFVLLLLKNAASRNMGLRVIASKFSLNRYSARTELGRRIEIYLRRQRLEILPGGSLDAPEDLFATVCLLCDSVSSARLVDQRANRWIAPDNPRTKS